MSSSDDPATIEIPDGCELSAACATDVSDERRQLRHGYLHEHEGAMWLCTTDSVIVVAVQVTASAAITEGFVPVEVLRHLEAGGNAEQLTSTAWRTIADGTGVTFDVAAELDGQQPVRPGALGMWDQPTGRPVMRVMLDMQRTATALRALGSSTGPCTLEFSGTRRPVRIVPGGHGRTRLGLQMPLVPTESDAAGG